MRTDPARALPLLSSILSLDLRRATTGSALLLALLTNTLHAQTPATVPHWSTFFGGNGHDLGAAVRFGPGSLITVVGTSDSTGLGTPGTFQSANAGGFDVIVARFDTSLPAPQQLLWCTYLGGAGMDLAFEAIVDGNGTTTVVGLTDSMQFPTQNGFQTTRNGSSDGFVAQLDITGTTLVYSTLIGGGADDRVCSVSFDSLGRLLVAGVTEGPGLPATAGTIFPTFLGGISDAFVARIDPSAAPPTQQLHWATHLGGPGQDGGAYWQIAANGGLGTFWEGNHKKQFVAELPDGSIHAVTVVNPPYATTVTTPNGLQPSGNGLSEVLLVTLDPLGQNLLYGTFFGGSQRDFPFAFALHPAGGAVIAGSTESSNLPTSIGALQTVNHFGANGANDAFVCWIDPGRGSGASQLRYSTYLGGDNGEDIFTAIAIESSGLVTLAGTGFGGGIVKPFPTTPGCLRPWANPWERCGAVVRLAMEGNGAADLVYSTLLGGAWTVLHSVTLDDVGDALVAGTTYDGSYPLRNPPQTALTSPREIVVTHLPLLPGGTSRLDLALATTACTDRLYASTIGAPVAGNLRFALTATNAPPSSLAANVLGFGRPLGGPLAIPGTPATLLVDPLDLLFVPVDALGHARRALPVPAGLPPGLIVHAQWLCLTNAACPGTGLLGASERLVFTTF